MEVWMEIYFANGNIKENEWLEFIQTISKYNGYLRKWKLIVIYDNNQFHYYIRVHHLLPPIIGLKNFLLKKVTALTEEPYLISFPYYSFHSLIHIFYDSEIKKNYDFQKIEISIFPIYQNRFFHKAYFFFKNQDTILRKKGKFINIYHLLYINFDDNKRFFYSKVPKYFGLKKLLPILHSDKELSILKIDPFPYLYEEKYIKQTDYNFDKHSFIIGSSGSGKSKFLSSFIEHIFKDKDLRKKYKIVVLDPHASLENDIGGIENSKVIDFEDLDDSIDLFQNNHIDTIATTELLLSLFKNLLKEQYNSKLERVLRYSIHLLLCNHDFSFFTLRKLLLDMEFRTQLVTKSEMMVPVSVIEFFATDFNELKTKSYGQAISPIISFIDEMQLLPVFNEKDLNQNLENVIQNHFLSIFSLNRTLLGEKITQTLSGLIMQQIFQLAQSKKVEEHIIFIIDEVALIENPILCSFLSEARKYKVSIMLAGQYFTQISEKLRNAIFANTINYYIFRVSRMDANLLVDNLDINITGSDKKDDKVSLLSGLNNRECVVRISSQEKLLPCFKTKTLDFMSIPRIKVKKDKTKTEEKENDLNITFSINCDISLKELMISSSSSRKKVR